MSIAAIIESVRIVRETNDTKYRKIRKEQMKKHLACLCILILSLGIAGMAGAIPINFDINGSSSSVTLSNVSTAGWTSIEAELVNGLDDVDFSLDDGESHTFDFFRLTVGGLGYGTADVNATLAFEEPAGSQVTGIGSGCWLTLSGIISGGYLNWSNMPQTIALNDDDGYFDVDFEDVCVAGFGNTTTVSATITAHASPVPEPATALLMSIGLGLLGLGTVCRKKLGKA